VTDAPPRWLFYLEWYETIPDPDVEAGRRTLHYAEPIGPYAQEWEAKAARAKYLAGTGWMPSGAHSPHVSELQRIGPPERKVRERLRDAS
jgi:hypothetical protein